MLTHKKRFFLLYMIFSLISACSVLPPLKTEQDTKYTLNALPSSVINKTHKKLTLLVMPLSGSAIYNTTQIAYTTKPYQVAYFAKNHWAQPPTAMLQPLLMRTLQNTQYFYAVDSLLTAEQHDYALNVQLMKLQQVFSADASEVELTIWAQLVDAKHKILVVRPFTVVVKASQNTPYGGVIAANKATAMILSQIANFCVSTVENLDDIGK